MKNPLYSLHSKWSLIAALITFRLQSFEGCLWRKFPEKWQYLLDLPNRDFLIFFPYTVSVGGARITCKNKKLSLGWRIKSIKDPVNIIAYGVNPQEFITLLREANPAWHRFLGSSHFLYGPTDKGWQASTAVKIDIDAANCERQHIRLFELKTTRGEKVTLGAAHRDSPHHTEKDPPRSWDETRNLVASGIASLGERMLYGLSEESCEQNWRGARGDGRILVINCKK